MFGSRKRERELYERIIVILADQIDWHRNAAGLPLLSRGVPVQLPQPGQAATPPQERMWVSEDEEVLAWQAENHVLDLDDARAALEQIGAANTEVLDYLS